MLGKVTDPAPVTTRKNDLAIKLVVLFHHIVVALVLLAVMPENKLDALGDLGFYVIGNDGILRVIPIAVFVAYAELHIAPHHSAKTVFVCYGDKRVHKLVENVKGRNVAVLIQERASTHIPSLVHSNVDSF